MIDNELVTMLFTVLGIGIGNIARTLLPYLQKLQDEPDIAFNWKYVLTALFSGGITALVIYPLFATSETVWWKVMIAAITFAWASNDIINNYSKGKGTTTIKVATTEDVKLNKIKKLEDKIAGIKSELEDEKKVTE